MELLVVPKSTPMAAVGMCRGVGADAVSKTLQIILALNLPERQCRAQPDLWPSMRLQLELISYRIV